MAMSIGDTKLLGHMESGLGVWVPGLCQEAGPCVGTARSLAVQNRRCPSAAGVCRTLNDHSSSASTHFTAPPPPGRRQQHRRINFTLASVFWAV
ncbi:hypothetical protein AAFF_G00246080 [Aldrovandia affinis]|uniref:Uncharacterized protein n=1 Tax=Aldrovandia affinis TaxID=143900 RepID=A0AAD7SUD1_9TELE|nr:hypothetical protein AAFF_G00246080 [Aldrovandia affinis]